MIRMCSRSWRRLAATVSLAAALSLAVLSACATTAPAGSDPPGGTSVINVVAAENFWGSLAEQLGGAHVKVVSIIDSPDADPHDYEPTAADGRAIAGAQLAIVNGVGYDPWATKLADANPSPTRTVLTVGDLVGVADGGQPAPLVQPGRRAGGHRRDHGRLQEARSGRRGLLRHASTSTVLEHEPEGVLRHHRRDQEQLRRHAGRRLGVDLRDDGAGARA